MVEGVGDCCWGDSRVELLCPLDAVGASELVDKGVEIGEVSSFGAIDDGEDLTGGKVLGCEYGNAIDGLGGEEGWGVDG